jgi:hypothetical protein
MSSSEHLFITRAVWKINYSSVSSSSFLRERERIIAAFLFSIYTELIAALLHME